MEHRGVGGHGGRVSVPQAVCGLIYRVGSRTRMQESIPSGCRQPGHTRFMHEPLLAAVTHALMRPCPRHTQGYNFCKSKGLFYVAYDDKIKKGELAVCGHSCDAVLVAPRTDVHLPVSAHGTWTPYPAHLQCRCDRCATITARDAGWAARFKTCAPTSTHTATEVGARVF